MEVRASHSSRRSNEPDSLSPNHGIADGHQWLAQVKIRGDDPATVIDVDDVSCQKEVVDERDDAAIRGTYWLTDCAAKVDPEVPAGQAAVEDASGPELARDYGCARAKKRRGPHWRRIVCPRADCACSKILPRDTGSGCRVEGTTEAAVDGKRLSNGGRNFWERETRANRLGLARSPMDDDARDEAPFRINRNRADRVPGPGCRRDEMQRLAGERAPDRINRIGARGRSFEC
jgi:hypothetical protein